MLTASSKPEGAPDSPQGEEEVEEEGEEGRGGGGEWGGWVAVHPASQPISPLTNNWTKTYAK